MTFLLWPARALLQRKRERPRANVLWIAIVPSMIRFGAGHLPLAGDASTYGFTAEVVARVVGDNAVFDVLAGVLNWRFGLEAAMIANSLAHVLDKSITHFVLA